MKKIFIVPVLFLTFMLTSCRVKPRTPSDTYSEAHTIFLATKSALADMKENNIEIDGFQVISSEMDMCIVTRDFEAEKFFQYLNAYVDIEKSDKFFVVLNGDYECMYAAVYDGKYIESYPSGIVTEINDSGVETKFMYADEQHKKCNYTYNEVYNICVSKLNEYTECEKDK